MPKRRKHDRAQAAPLPQLDVSSADALLRSLEAVPSRSHPAVGEALTAALADEADAHSLLLSAVEALAAGMLARKSGQAAASCRMLLDCLARLSAPPAPALHARAAALAVAQPRLFRKLCAAFARWASVDGGAFAGPAGLGQSDALAATQSLIASGEEAEAALLVVRFDLEALVDADALVDRLASSSSGLGAALSLAAPSPRLQLRLVEALSAQGDPRLAARYVARFRLTRSAPQPLLAAIALGLHRARLGWLVREGLADQLDSFFARAAEAIEAGGGGGGGAAAAGGGGGGGEGGEGSGEGSGEEGEEEEGALWEAPFATRALLAALPPPPSLSPRRALGGASGRAVEVAAALCCRAPLEAWLTAGRGPVRSEARPPVAAAARGPFSEGRSL